VATTVVRGRILAREKGAARQTCKVSPFVFLWGALELAPARMLGDCKSVESVFATAAD